MNSVDRQYKELLNHILQNGVKKQDRTGTGTISIFDYSMRFNMKEGFPLLTSKKMFTKGVILELIWFLRGDTNIKFLVENGCHIWDGDAYKKFHTEAKKIVEAYECGDILGTQPHIEEIFSQDLNILTKEEFINKIKTDDKFAKKWGELGPVYGKQWRSWETYEKLETDFIGTYRNSKSIDQITNLINDLKTNPDSRRLMVSAWNVSVLEQMTLPPCHYGFQCYTYEMSSEERIKEWCDSLGKDVSFAEDIGIEYLNELNFPTRKLSLKWTQRSVDVGLGLGFNIASYGLLLHLLSKEVNMIPEELIFSGGDCHIYLNHVDGLREQLKRETFKLPILKLKNSSLDTLEYQDIEITNYKSSDVIKLELSN